MILKFINYFLISSLVFLLNCPGNLERNFLKNKYPEGKNSDFGILQINLENSDNFEYKELTVVLTQSQPELSMVNGEYYIPYSLHPIPLVIPVAILKGIYPIISNNDRLVFTHTLTKSNPIVIDIPEGSYYASIFNSGDNFPITIEAGLNAVTLGLFGYNYTKTSQHWYDYSSSSKNTNYPPNTSGFLNFPVKDSANCQYETISNNDFFLTAGINKSVCPKIEIFKSKITKLNLNVSAGITDGDGTLRKWVFGIFVLHPFIYGLKTEIRDYQFVHSPKQN